MWYYCFARLDFLDDALHMLDYGLYTAGLAAVP